jgi:hypothetical protein
VGADEKVDGIGQKVGPQGDHQEIKEDEVSFYHRFKSIYYNVFGAKVKQSGLLGLFDRQSGHPQ